MEGAVSGRGWEKGKGERIQVGGSMLTRADHDARVERSIDAYMYSHDRGCCVCTHEKYTFV